VIAIWSVTLSGLEQRNLYTQDGSKTPSVLGIRYPGLMKVLDQSHYTLGAHAYGVDSCPESVQKYLSNSIADSDFNRKVLLLTCIHHCQVLSLLSVLDPVQKTVLVNQIRSYNRPLQQEIRWRQLRRSLVAF
jgi:hypothetical protein